MRNPRFSGKTSGFNFLLTFVFSFVTVAATFFVSVSEFGFKTKSAIFLSLTAAYLATHALYHWHQRRKISEAEAEAAGSLFTGEIEAKLLALEEANEFFGASLKSADMFRLVASRVGEIMPFAACVMFLRGDKDFLVIKFAAGEKSAEFLNFKSDIHRTLAAKILLSGKAQIDNKLFFDRMVFPPGLLKDFNSAIALPLYHREEVFAVLTLYAREKNFYDENTQTLLEAAAERIAPLFASSFAFERSMSNALTDSLTNLPNERALFLMLETQVAESHRFREERPLSVLAIDIRNFSELNEKFGHSAGDNILTFAAATIKKQLRQMDVLSRSTGDEFLVVLPTANEKIAQEIIGRVERAFASQPFEILGQEKIYLELNFGAATFWRDGETANELINTALLKKGQVKSSEKSKILWFPKEFVN